MSETSEVLRRAAGLMRERAEAATPGPWEPSKAYRTNVVAPTGQIIGRGNGSAITDAAGESFNSANAAHIASWHPAVALAVADWLDGVALFEEARDDEEMFDLDGDPIAPEDTHAIGSALAVARAYLGADQ